MIQDGWYKASNSVERYLKKMFPKRYYLDSQGEDKWADNDAQGGENGGRSGDDAKSDCGRHKSQVSGIIRCKITTTIQIVQYPCTKTITMKNSQ